MDEFLCMHHTGMYHKRLGQRLRHKLAVKYLLTEEPNYRTCNPQCDERVLHANLHGHGSKRRGTFFLFRNLARTIRATPRGAR